MSFQCQIRFGGRKEIASDSDSRVICLCAQLEAVLQHGLRRTRGLALTAAALKQAAGFTNKTETVSWAVAAPGCDAPSTNTLWSAACHTLLADRLRLGTFYEDWAFLVDEERASMLPTMAAGLNSILFAINIDNSDLNGGVARGAGSGSSSVSHLLKESTQGIGSLWKESAQGVSSLLREISNATSTAAAGVVPGFPAQGEASDSLPVVPRRGEASDPLPVVPRSASAELTFWLYVKEHLNRHELQRFYALRHICSELGRGRAWLRCALNEHSLERSLHTLLADRLRLGTFYEDWAFLVDEERASMLPTMAAGSGSSSVSHLLKESTQGIGSLWKESAQGVSSLLREISNATSTAAAGVVPGFPAQGEASDSLPVVPRRGEASDPLPVVPRSASADSGLQRERRRRRKVTNIISFDDDLEAGDEEEGGDDEEARPRRPPAMRKSHTAPPAAPAAGVPQGNEEEEEEEEEEERGRRASPPPHNGLAEPQEELGGAGSPRGVATAPPAIPPVSPPTRLPHRTSIDDDEEEEEEEEDEEEAEVYQPRALPQAREQVASDQMVEGSLSSVSTWSPLQVMTDHCSSDILIPVTPADQQPGWSLVRLASRLPSPPPSPPLDSLKP
ncbi:hypothetical protein CRUP_004678 [Coryphaenoides rupestris]|nr:hypothetical protein CRUP_004678 [Coryphaenoides rupestris]